ncbi:MAG: flagellar basal-body MS-ring/collar protein FliF, partial [Bacillota bacterium]
MDKWISHGMGQITELWRGLTKAQKVRIGAIFVISAMAIGLLLSFAMRTEYSAVFTGLSDQDAGDMTAKLTELKIPNRVSASSNGTNNVLVPTAQVTTARLKLASAGLPKGSAGLGDIKDIPITSTEQQRRYLYQMALQGELERTLTRIEGVQAAKVLLTIPEQPLFLRPNETREPSAAVVLTLKPGVQLDTNQIQGILHLVAHSVEGLKTQNITITDQYSRQLNRNSTDPTSDTKAQELKYELQKNVQTLFDQVFGLGNANAVVNVVMNLDRAESQSTVYTPPIPGSNEGIIKDVERLNEIVKGASTGAAPGSTTNIPGAGSVNNQGSQGASEREQQKISYLVNEVKQTIVKAPEIKDLSVAVAVNTKKIKLDDQLTQSIRETVASATGATQQKVTVLPYDFVPA